MSQDSKSKKHPPRRNRQKTDPGTPLGKDGKPQLYAAVYTIRRKRTRFGKPRFRMRRKRISEVKDKLISGEGRSDEPVRSPPENWVGTDDLRTLPRLDEKRVQKREWVPVEDGDTWKCIRCGKCCGNDLRVNLTWKEYDRVKRLLPVKHVVKDPHTGMSHPVYHIKGHCAQYDPKLHRCAIYRDRLYTCATYPFAVSADGTLIRSVFCPGFGHGPGVNMSRTIRHIKSWKKKAGMI